MLIVNHKRHGINIIDCWYAEQSIKQKGIIRYKYYIGDMPSFSHVKDRTLLSDLTETEEKIIEKFTKNCRYEIRRAPKEGVKCSFFFGKEIKDDMIESFVDFYEAFWKSKGREFLDRKKCIEEIKRYVERDAFAISVALLEKRILVYHTYIIEESRVRLYQSASQFRCDDKGTQQIIGFANRYLHKEDMLYFKNKGKKVYDWGGAGDSEEVLSITRFKESFGGCEFYCYNGEEIRGIKAMLYYFLVKIFSVLWNEWTK